nr:hypothetical protein [uncultured Campylobacter sp.]
MNKTLLCHHLWFLFLLSFIAGILEFQQKTRILEFQQKTRILEFQQKTRILI